MSRTTLPSLLLLLLCLPASCADDGAETDLDAAPGVDAGADGPEDGAYPSNLVELVESSSWIFLATVNQLHAATEEQPPPFADPLGLWDLRKMIVVEIDRVSLEPLERELPPGSADTIILRGPPEPELSVGTQAWFFVTMFMAGDSWVFLEEGHWPADRVDPGAFHRKVQEVQRYLLDRDLYQRMLGADRVIRGTTTTTEDLPDPISEDGPDWWVGTVQPRNTLRGPVEVSPLAVRYQATANPCCYLMPKLPVGEERILLLYPDDLSGFPGPALMVADPLDVQSTGELERLRSLLASPPEPPAL